MVNFADQNVIITGGATSLGFQLAQKLAALGAKVTICGRRAERLNQAVQVCPALNAVCLNIQDSHSNKLLFNEATRFGGGPVSLLINNAGFLAKNETDDTIEQMFATNSTAPIELTKRFINQCQAQSMVVQISSLAGSVPIKALKAYGESKKQLMDETIKLRAEAINKGCTLSIVHTPGFESSMSEHLNVKKIDIDEVAEAILAGIKARQEDIYPSTESKIAVSGMKYMPKLTTFIANRRYNKPI